MEKYDHKAVEKKWQDAWAASGIYKADDSSEKPKSYVLDMFPYPSGSGLHAGHVEGYTATDIYARFMRMQGHNVLHPMGWDAFGLPAENYAIKTKVHPRITTEDAINNFRRQIKSLGLSYDWTREVGTHTPEYYQWTQWFFLLMYKHGLAEKRKAKVNWCPSCQTVLANEQVVDGTCERCGTEVIQKDLEQWFFKITKYAEDLLDGLDAIDWPESTKIAQRNWIGKSEGAEIDFTIAGGDETVTVFTTRPDTLFGATYLVLAPESELAGQLAERAENKDEVEAYIAATQKKTDLERAESKEKTGAELRGVMAINPANNEEIPVWIADYVIGSYGTGAIMAVPAHDERDFAFAKKMDIAVREVVLGNAELPRVEYGSLINSGRFDGMSSEEAKRAITEAVGGRMKTTYRLRDWLVSRQRYWGAPIPMILCDACGTVPVPEEQLPVILPEDVDFVPHGESPLATSESFHKGVTCPKCGADARRESDTMDTFVCSSWYYYRFTDPKNTEEFASKEQIARWLPVDIYVGGAEHTVLHLLYSRFFTKVLQEYGYVDFNEPFQKLRHQGMILAEDGRKMSKSLGNVVNPDEVVEQYGADALRMYEMFMGPLEDAKPWNTKNISGVKRFLDRVWRVQESFADTADAAMEVSLHKAIKKVGEDIRELKYNTAISAMMIAVNDMEKFGVTKEQLGTFLKVLAPFAPHMAEELWAGLGNAESIHLESWPEYDESKLVEDTVKIAVQVNGKVRATIAVPADIAEEELKQQAREAVGEKWLTGEIKKEIVVPGRLVSFVVI